MGLLEVGVVFLSLLQGGLMAIDEWVFHRRRGLSLWELWGHPVDSFLYVLPLSVAAHASATSGWLAIYLLLCVVSCLVITKDEWVHARECVPGEHWIHSLLFIVHPVVLWGVGTMWIQGEGTVLRRALPVLILAYASYQILRVIFSEKKKRHQVNNSFYETLGTRWYDDDTHAIALLRVEARYKLTYVLDIFSKLHLSKSVRVLDIGCGAGFISNPLAAQGYDVKGIDASPNAVAIARRYAPQNARVSYEAQNAYALQESDGSFDVVLMLDFLEHVDHPSKAIAEAARVLKNEGILIFHTFNRTLWARLLAVHGIQFVTKDCPSHIHVYHLFLKPRELEIMANAEELSIGEWRGIRPKITKAFFRSLCYRRVHPEFEFTFCASLAVGYLGYFGKLKRACRLDSHPLA